jgi:molybdopterin-guanine dinucleotide biosynthesis adapter protein
VRRSTSTEPPIFPRDPNVIAVATDHAIETALPVLDLNDAAKIAAFIVDRLRLA